MHPYLLYFACYLGGLLTMAVPFLLHLNQKKRYQEHLLSYVEAVDDFRGSSERLINSYEKQIQHLEQKVKAHETTLLAQ